MEHMILLLQPDRAQIAALDELAAQQQDRRSSQFHNFLTPAQFCGALRRVALEFLHFACSTRLVSRFRGAAILGRGTAFQPSLARFSAPQKMISANIKATQNR